MSDLFLCAVTDMAANVKRDGWDISLTEPGEAAVTAKGMVFRDYREVDPDTNSGVSEPFTQCVIPISELSTIPAEEWEVSTTDATGAAVSGLVIDVRVNRTWGIVTLFVEADGG